MKRALLAVLLPLALGVTIGEGLTTSLSVREWIGHVVRRGELQTLVGRRGIYENDVERAWRVDLFSLGAESWEVEEKAALAQKNAALQRLIEQQRVHEAAAGEVVGPAVVAGETQLLRDQFLDEKTWQKSLTGAGLTAYTVAQEVTSNLRERAWLEKQMANQLRPNDSEVKRYYDQHRSAFQEPLRFHAAHLFLAAPEGYPDDVIARQNALIGQFAKRIANGESFPALVAQFSEDKATKKRDGDLGYFAETRLLPEVFATAEELQPGQISGPVRSRLGFHIIRLTETQLPRQLSLEEARPEIIALLENQKRAAAVAALR